MNEMMPAGELNRIAAIMLVGLFAIACEFAWIAYMERRAKRQDRAALQRWAEGQRR